MLSETGVSVFRYFGEAGSWDAWPRYTCLGSDSTRRSQGLTFHDRIVRKSMIPVEWSFIESGLLCLV